MTASLRSPSGNENSKYRPLPEVKPFRRNGRHQDSGDRVQCPSDCAESGLLHLKILPRPGFEPGSPTRKAGILSATSDGVDRAVRWLLYTTGADRTPSLSAIRAFASARIEVAPLAQALQYSEQLVRSMTLDRVQNHRPAFGQVGVPFLPSTSRTQGGRYP
jgi:hypothetical protein